MMNSMRARVLLPALMLLAKFAFGDAPQPPYREMDAWYSNPDAPNVDLRATLTEPLTGGPFPAVLLTQGAGPQDRNETIGPLKPFQVLADYLTRRGIAVLRADKRGVGASLGSFKNVTTKGFATDAEAGVRYLQSRSEIDPKQIGLIGHGEGAIEAVMVANDIPSIAFVVLLEGTGVPGEQVLLEQTERAEKAANMPPGQIKVDRRVGKTLYEMAKQGKSESEMRAYLFSYERSEGYDPGFTAHWEKKLNSFQDPWLRFFLGYDPAPGLAKLRCPVLALSGGKDLQVIAEQNVPAMKAALAKDKDARVEILPGLNYFLQPAQTGLAYEFPTSPVAMSPLALQKIGDWIAAHTHLSPAAKESPSQS